MTKEKDERHRAETDQEVARPVEKVIDVLS